jgi:hypothetical protein
LGGVEDDLTGLNRLIQQIAEPHRRFQRQFDKRVRAMQMANGVIVAALDLLVAGFQPAPA